MTYDDWMKKVDRYVIQKTGLSYMDLPDICYRKLYDDNLSPSQAASEAIRYAME